MSDISKADCERLVNMAMLLNDLQRDFCALDDEITEHFSVIREKDPHAYLGVRNLTWEDLISIMQKDVSEALGQ